jgi:DNA-binding LacI/PurR family transcriptional regulator
LLNELEIPVVLINNQHPSRFLHSVSIDNTDGGYQATRHLLDLGHSAIAYLGDESGLQSDVERHQGYKNALDQKGLPLRQEFVVSADGKPAGAFKTAMKLLSRPNRPSAVFCYNDMSALGVLQAAAKQHLSIPEDLSVVGFDDIFFAERLHPPLTTVHQPKTELGRDAMNLLIALLKGEDVEKIVTVRGHLIVRGSTANLRKPPHQAI